MAKVEIVKSLFEEIQNRYSLYDNCVIETGVDLDGSIVDYDRLDEGPGLKESHNKIRRKLKTG